MSFQAHPDTIEKKTGQTPRKVVAGYFLSLDGVAEAPDRFITAWDDETDASGANLIATQDAVILGRRSYDEWAEFWPGSDIQPFASFINAVLRRCQREHAQLAAQIDRDVAVTGALLHDIGKLEAYTADPVAIDLADAGRLQGEIPLGYYRIRRSIEELPGFPRQTAQAVLHIILSHHGALEHGSPVVPCTREAWLVHMVDNLGGKLGSFDRLEKELPPGATWTGFDRGIGASAYFGPVSDEAERRAA